MRIDGAGATHALLDWLSGQRLSYSVGFGLPANTAELLAKLPDHLWQVAYDADDYLRLFGPQVEGERAAAESAGALRLLDLPPFSPGTVLRAGAARRSPSGVFVLRG